MEDLTISLITFKEKEISFHFSKIDFVITISPSELEFVSFSVCFYTSSLKNIDADGKNIILLIVELMITIHAMSCDTYYINLSN